MKGIGIRKATGVTGLSIRQLRYLDDHGHLGPVERINQDRRFTEEQLARARRIHELMNLGLSMEQSAAFANGKADASLEMRVRDLICEHARKAVDLFHYLQHALGSLDVSGRV